MDYKNKEKWTSSAIRYANYDKQRGGYIASKNTHQGATDFTLLDYKTMEPKIFKNADDALKAKADKQYGWYH